MSDALSQDKPNFSVLANSNAYPSFCREVDILPFNQSHKQDLGPDINFPLPWSPTQAVNMLPAARARFPSVLSRRLISSSQVRKGTTKGITGDNPIPANVPPSQVREPPPSTSGTPVPTSSTGSGDRTLQEMPEKAEERRVMQSPNRKSVWSRSQNPREMAMSGPRFEQTIMEDQVGEDQLWQSDTGNA